MPRTAVYSALVLRCRPSGESNTEATLLTAEEGLIRATVFGGPKSKLRAYAAAYNSGQVWIYRDKAKEYAKLSDFDVQSWRPGLRELYERTMAAGAVAETILSTHGGGGDWASAIKLACGTLDALETANEELCPQLLVHFLWRWVGFLGLCPHVEACAACGDRAENSPLWFNAHEGAVFCSSCASSVPEDLALSPQNRAKNRALSPKNAANSEHTPNQQLDVNRDRAWFSDAAFRRGTELDKGAAFRRGDRTQNPGLLQLSPGCRRWLAAVGQLEASELHRFSPDSRSFNEAKSLTAAVLSGAIGKRLTTWDW